MKQGFSFSLIAPAKSYWISQWAAAARAHGWRERSVRASSDGFTLLELSIVLVIIGLIIGGITVGADMIRSAELNSIVSDYHKYKVAVNSYKLKYNALPGDHKNATAYWGAAHATPATCYTTASTGTETCDGNGDGMINSADGGTNLSERYRMWQHLANAEILSGQFTGVAGAAGTYDSDVGINVPEHRMNGGVLTMYSGNDLNQFAEHRNKQSMSFFAELPAGLFGGFIPPTDAMTIDTKIDDGKPGLGKVYNLPQGSAYNPDCTTTAVASTSEYALTDLDALCTVMMNFP